jgi:tripartite-type tricarboxylate transporter receptor subunit TctC
VEVYFTSTLSTRPYAQTGRVRMIAMGSLQRSPSAPDIPTVVEAGFPGFEVVTWWGVLVPAATPRDIVGRLHAEVLKIMASADARERMAKLGADILTGTPQEFAARIKAESATWAQVIKESGARVD